MTVKYQTLPFFMAARTPRGPDSSLTVSSSAMTSRSAFFSSLSRNLASCGLLIRKKYAATPATTASIPSTKNMTCQPWTPGTWSPMLISQPDSGAPSIWENGWAR